MWRHIIFHHNRLGWTQDMIAEIVGLSRQRIEQIANNFNFENIHNFFKKGQTMEKIVEINGLDNF